MDERPQSIHLFACSDRPLEEDTNHLERILLINILHGEARRELTPEIQIKLEHEHGRRPGDYRVFPMNDRHYYFFVIAPTEGHFLSMRDHGPYTMYPTGVIFNLQQWRRNINMQRDLTPIQAWISIRNIPLQAWRTRGLIEIVSNFGFIRRTIQYGFQAGNFEEIKFMIISPAVELIPHEVLYHESLEFTPVEIILHTWRRMHSSPFPAPQELLVTCERGLIQFPQPPPPLHADPTWSDAGSAVSRGDNNERVEQHHGRPEKRPRNALLMRATQTEATNNQV